MDRRDFLEKSLRGIGSLITLISIPILSRCTPQNGIERIVQPTPTPRPQTRQPDYLELEYASIQSAFVPLDYPDIISAIDPRFKDKLILYRFEEDGQAAQFIPNFSTISEKSSSGKGYNEQGTTIDSPPGTSVLYLLFPNLKKHKDYTLTDGGERYEYRYEITPRNLEGPYSIILRDYKLEDIKLALTLYKDASIQNGGSFSIFVEEISESWDEKTIHSGNPETVPAWSEYDDTARAENFPFYENRPNTKMVFDFSNDAFDIITKWFEKPSSNYGIRVRMIEPSSPPVFRTFYSSRDQNQSNHPKLILSFRAR